MPLLYSADLERIDSATRTVEAEHGVISGHLEKIKFLFQDAELSWDSPSAATFQDVSQWFVRSSEDLSALLEEIVRRMKGTSRTLRNAEEVNAHNISPDRLKHNTGPGVSRVAVTGSGHGSSHQPGQATEGRPEQLLPRAHIEARPFEQATEVQAEPLLAREHVEARPFEQVTEVQAEPLLAREHVEALPFDSSPGGSSMMRDGGSGA